jgi:hypothetical protein
VGAASVAHSWRAQLDELALGMCFLYGEGRALVRGLILAEASEGFRRQVAGIWFELSRSIWIVAFGLSLNRRQMERQLLRGMDEDAVPLMRRLDELQRAPPAGSPWQVTLWCLNEALCLPFPSHGAPILLQ